MNDCFWYLADICNEECRCCGYRSLNDKEGQRLYEEYSEDVRQALDPVKEKWKQRFEDC